MAGRFITAFVASKADLVALVGDRVRPVGGEQATDVGKDYITYQQIDAAPVGELSDYSADLSVDRYQVSIIAAGSRAADYTRIRKIARLLKGVRGDRRLNGFRSAGIIGGVLGGI